MSNLFTKFSSGLRIGSVANVGALPVTAQKGSLIWVDSEAAFYQYDGAAWTAITAGVTPEFTDADFRIKDDVDPSKEIAFQAAGISASTTRTITMPDANVDLGNLTNSNIAAAAAIAYSKLALSNSIVNADVAAAAAIAYSKLNLAASIVDADVAAAAAIAYSKLNLAASIVNADIAAAADISYSKLADLTGAAGRILVQSAGDKVEAHASIQASDLFLKDGSVAATAAFNMNSFKITNLADPTASQDAATKNYVDTLDAQNIKKDGSVAMTANLNLGGFKITSLAAPVAGTDAANKNYVDNAITGLSWRKPVDLLDTVSSAKPTAAPSSIDGVVVTTGMRVLFTNLSGGESADNEKVFKATVGGSISWALETDGQAGTGAPTDSDALLINQGTANGDSQWNYNGTDWVQFSGAGQIQAGIGLLKTGNTLDINLGAGIAELPSDEVGIDVHANGGLFLTVDNSAASGATAAQLAVKLDGSTLSKGASGLKVAALGITNAEVATAAGIKFSKLDSAAIDANLIPDANGTRNLGSVANEWNNLYVQDILSANQLGVTAANVVMTSSTGDIDLTSAAQIELNASTLMSLNATDGIIIDAGDTMDIQSTAAMTIQTDDVMFLAADNLDVTGDILPNLDLTYDLGSATKRMAQVWTKEIQSGAETMLIASTAAIEVEASNLYVSAASTSIKTDASATKSKLIVADSLVEIRSATTASTADGSIRLAADKIVRADANDANSVTERATANLTLAAGTGSFTAIANLTFAHATYNGAVIKYRMKEATTNRVRIGELRVVTDGTNISFTDMFNESAVLGANDGLLLEAAINGSNVEIRFKDTHASNATSMRCDVELFHV